MMGSMRLPCHHRGFTLLEVLVAVVILAILTSMAVPAFQSWLGDATLASSARGLVNGINLARSQALETGTPTLICPYAPGACGSDWSQGWAVWQNPASGTPTLIAAGQTPSSSVQMNVRAPAASITFASDGLPNTTGTWTLCDQRGATQARSVSLFGAGTVFADTTPGTSALGQPLVCP